MIRLGFKFHLILGIVKKLLIALALMVPAFLMSYSPEQPSEAQVSMEAPEVAIANGDSTVSLKSLRGKYVVLNFWSKNEPSSRIDNHFYGRSVAMAADPDIVYISICTDSSDEQLSQMLVAEDGNNPSTQYYRSQLAGQDNSQAYTREGLATWLISPQGVVIAKNPGYDAVALLKG